MSLDGYAEVNGHGYRPVNPVLARGLSLNGLRKDNPVSGLLDVLVLF
jgi:hypothetical protein